MKWNLTNKGVLGSKEIVAIAIALLMIAIVLPIGLNEIGKLGGQINPPLDNGYHNENWGTSRDIFVVLMVTVIPILAVLGIALKLM